MTTQNPGNQQPQNGNGAAIVRGPAARKQAIEKALNDSRKSLTALLPTHVRPDQMIRSVMAAVAKTPDLMVCTPTSIVMATAQACALGLPPNTPLGLGYLVPFKTECTFIPGYRGLVRLAVQSGEVKGIMARAVHENDEFDIHMGTDPKIIHVPNLSDRGNVIGTYAIAKMPSGEREFDWMSIGEINAIRDRSKASDSGPWKTDWVEMARKTVVRRLCKYLPLSEEKLGRALELQAAAEAGVPDFSDVIDVIGETVDVETGEVTGEKPEPSRTDALKDRVAAKAASGS